MSLFNSTGKDYRVLWGTVFRDVPHTAGPFRSRNWTSLLLSEGIYMDQKRLAHLEDAITGDGADYVIVSNKHGANGRDVHVDKSGLDKALEPIRTLLFAHDDLYLFDARGRWGMICTIAEYSILGGVDSIVERFTELAGGTSKLRAEFLEWTRSQSWELSTHGTSDLLEMAGWK